MGSDADVISEWEQQARLDLYRAQISESLWNQPLMADDEIPVACRLAPSTYQALKAKGQGPRSFLIGRRRFSLTEDVRIWLAGWSSG
jgi:hypothetical protein